MNKHIPLPACFQLTCWYEVVLLLHLPPLWCRYELYCHKFQQFGLWNLIRKRSFRSEVNNELKNSIPVPRFFLHFLRFALCILNCFLDIVSEIYTCRGRKQRNILFWFARLTSCCHLLTLKLLYNSGHRDVNRSTFENFVYLLWLITQQD